jgi:hypothetical protein
LVSEKIKNKKKKMVAGRERIANEQVSGVSIEVGKYSVY